MFIVTTPVSNGAGGPSPFGSGWVPLEFYKQTGQQYFNPNMLKITHLGQLITSALHSSMTEDQRIEPR